LASTLTGVGIFSVSISHKLVWCNLLGTRTRTFGSLIEW
jgi:hypothetical protein